jgi:hypothetical protein
MTDSSLDLESIGFAVYATQGGGLARYNDGASLVFYEVPDTFPEAKVGDLVPAEWDFQPANAAAHEEMLDVQYVTVQPDTPLVRVDDKLRCACGTYANGKVNYRGDAACSEWPDCVLD